MLRRKLGTTVQVNLRITEKLRRELEAAAKEHGVTFSLEVRSRLIGSLTQSLASYLADFARRAREIIEHSTRKKDIEATWRRLRALDAKSARFYADVEEELLPYLQDPKVRELLRGAQQEREKGGKA